MKAKEHYEYYNKLRGTNSGDAICIHCGGIITLKGEDYYMITKKLHMYRNAMINLYFHGSCFEVIAGDRYTVESYNNGFI
jgi:hypothetical protein